MPRFESVLATIQAEPWAIEPTHGQRLAALLTRRLSGARATPAELAEAADIRAARDQKRKKPKPAAVAVIPLYGPMVHRADAFDEVSGVVGTATVGQWVDAAANDPAIDAIVLDVDSPGGSVLGTAELAQKVADATKKKKVIAVANGLMASAAYFVGSQASELVASPSSMVGSIGVYQMHLDQSAALAEQGVKITLVSSTPEKVAGNSYEPLTEMGVGQITDTVMGYYKQFVKAVADGRRVNQETVRETFGRGGVVLAREAVAKGMADKVGTLDEVLSRYGLHSSDLTAMADAGKGPDMGLELRKRKLRLT
jgi:capsid assembly protease